MKKKNNKYVIILLALVMFISVGYALIATTLEIGGFANVSRVSWKIYFDNIRVLKGEKFQVEAPVASNKNTTTLNYKIALEDPGDEYSFDVDVVNDGTIDAMISLINNSELTEEQNKITDYIITYSDSTPITEKNFLPKHSRDSFKVTVKFKRDIQMEDLPSSDSEVNLSLRVEYSQAKDADLIRNNAVKSRVIKDLSGKGNDAVMSYGAVKNDGGTITLNGENQIIDLGLDNHDFGSGVSLVIRTRFDKIRSERDQEFFGNWEVAGLGLYLTSEGKINASIMTEGSYKFFASDFIVNTSDYYTIILTYDGSKIKIYANGNAISRAGSTTDFELPVTGNVAVSSLPIYMGGNPNIWDNELPFQNPSAITVDDALIFDRALTAEEISANYTGAIDGEAISFDKIIAYYDFN